VPFNEYWGQFDAAAIANWVKQYDPSRLVSNASGFYDQGAGDVYDMHIYMSKITHVTDPLGTRAPVLGEYGGKTWAVENHLWSDKRFGYGATDNQTDYQAAYSALMHDEITVAIHNGLAGAVYTQLTDVEIEINGMLTYDRAVSKITPTDLTSIHDELYREFSDHNGTVSYDTDNKIEDDTWRT
ncbi:MAG: hypothetical protein V7754_22330, partial [Halioglobus sp.]